MEQLREYEFSAVQKATLAKYGPDPSVKDAANFDELFEVIADDQVDGILDELDSKPY